MNRFIITFDIDWAPDFAIDDIAAILRANRVRATWFVTHQSAAVERLRAAPDLFELGLHPNFLPGSTHGKTPLEALEHLQAIVPGAISLRTHALVQSSPLLEMFITQTTVKVDSSLFLPNMPHIQPIEHYRNVGTLLRVPFFWADTYEMEKVNPCWRLAPLLGVEGLKVMTFHPIHLYLNLSEPASYQAIKQRAPSLTGLTPDAADPYIRAGAGPRTLFQELVERLASEGESLRLQDVYTAWRKAGDY